MPDACSATRFQDLHGLQVITEDSDMLAYGCPHVLFKMDRTGVGQEVCMARLPEARGPSFVGFSRVMFLEVCSCAPHAQLLDLCMAGRALPCSNFMPIESEIEMEAVHSVSVSILPASLLAALKIDPEQPGCMQMCILAGCDFLKALSKIGIKKAHAHIRKFKTFVRVGTSLSGSDRLCAPHIHFTSRSIVPLVQAAVVVICLPQMKCKWGMQRALLIKDLLGCSVRGQLCTTGIVLH